ncbi:Symplekin [Trichinella papuae]|uniref:Symplekin n=1 Tax=Trichinella papuae TaxID=268474 RepID=A0A0V1N624_9BILA|nr:Symplekin [Trichinella papuae]
MFTSVIKHRPGQRKELYSPTKDLVKELALNHLHSFEQAVPPDYLLLDENEEKSGMKDQFEFLFPDVYVACGVNVKHLINTYLSKPIKQSSIPVNDIVQLNSLNAELVNAAWTLYTKRQPDIRFLILVLPALNKQQFISLFLKLIRLPAQIFKMITDKHLLSSDLLSGIIKQISEREVVPVIFFHTIPLLLEAQASLDNVIGSVLQNFVTKQIWKQGEDVWQAFVQCSSKLKIHGYAALLQLPASQLRNAIETCPELRQDLLNHVENMESQQRASIT